MLSHFSNIAVSRDSGHENVLYYDKQDMQICTDEREGFLFPSSYSI
jgi:hypothetical protein